MRASKKAEEEGGIELTGTVVERVFGKGSKSERTAIYLETDDGDYHLRRRGGNPFFDPELKKLIGEKVKATGMGNHQLFVASAMKKLE